MEDALAQSEVIRYSGGEISLNPCCNGRCTRTQQEQAQEDAKASLNPCCNGRCTRTIIKLCSRIGESVVLILVVMEDALAQGGQA